ncbi:dihydroorotase [Halobaculum sp. MBLA0147]|uniref:dihydroorotase n=1 Tax=Halobaculum sp. MBLA0147 TaxID=3079934 RepID=UPI003525E0CF
MLFTAATLADGRTRDVRVRDGEIVAVAPTLDPDPGEETVDASEYHLLPGAVDAHVHFRQPGYPHKEDWTTGSRAAAAGGVTTVVDQPNTDPATVDGAAFDTKAELAADSLVDYGLNGGVTADWDPEGLFERPLFALGEVFLADSTGDMGIDEELFQAALARASDADVPVTVHAEDATLFEPAALEGNDESGAGDGTSADTDGTSADTDGTTVDGNGRAGDATGRAAPADRWSRYRPAEAEVAAVETALAAAEREGASIHVAHTSTPEAVDRVAAAAAEADDDRRVTCEVTPHHLLLSRDDLDALGTFGRMNPPLRSERRRAALFERVRDGTVDLIATDHAPHTTAEKETALTDAPSGVPGVETLLPLLLGEVVADRLDVARVRDLVAATPAAVFGLPQKGRVAPGSDADLVLVDLDDPDEVRGERLHSKCEWTPFEGARAVFPELTLLRGQVVYDGRGDAEQFGEAIGRNVRE